MRGGNLSLVEALQRGYAAHQASELAEAERIYRLILRAEPNQFDALHLLGVLEAQRGNHGEANRLLGRALNVNPRSVDALNNRANVLRTLGRNSEALASCDRALSIKPNFAEALNNRGNVLHDLHRLEEALESYDKALAVKPGYANALANRADVLRELSRFDEALASCDQALAVSPDLAEALNTRALVLHELRRFAEALACYERALAVRPNYAKALANKARVLQDLKRNDDALDCYRRALDLDTAYAEGHADFADFLAALGRREDAIAHYKKARRLKPSLTEAHFGLCMNQLPILYHDEREIAERRSAYGRSLARLRDAVESGKLTGDLAAGLGSNLPFYLAYQGLNDRDLQGIYGALACRIVADRYARAPLPPPPNPTERVRIGIVCGFFCQHSVWSMPVSGWLSQLDRRRFRMFGYHTRPEHDAATEIAATLCDRFVQGPLSIERWREAILSDAPHVLIYPEIGMDGASLLLATQRLAPVQCTSWGHPTTSGLPTLDYFLSSELMEPADAQEHYTERLVRLPNLSVYIEPAKAAAGPVGRAELGLPADAMVYWCGQSLFKYLPQYDQIYPRIAREVPSSRFVFIESAAGPTLSDLFRSRLVEAFESFGLDAERHCVFLSRLNPDRFAAAMGQSDAFLDSVGWSGCNSTATSLCHNLPIVTIEGSLMRGRHSAAILRRIGVEDTIVDTLDAYVAAAARLAREPAWRLDLSKRIAAGKDRVYRDRECIAALENFLEKAARNET